jgi:hypothetical protein
VNPGLAGTVAVIAVIALSLGTDALLRALGILAPLGQSMAAPLFALAAAYRTVYGVLGGYLAARLASRKRMACAGSNGILGTVMNLVGLVIAWNAGPELGPLWYPMILTVTALPTSWLGARLATQPSHSTD